MAFCYFNRLPRELRNEVWAIAIDPERTHEAYIRKAINPDKERDHSEDAAEPLEYAMVPWPTSQVCHEARDEAIRRGFIPATPLADLPPAYVEWERLQFICAQRHMQQLLEAPWATNIVHLVLVQLTKGPCGRFKDIVRDMKLAIHHLECLQKVTMHEAVETHKLDNAICFPCEWFGSMNAISQELVASSRTELEIELAASGVPGSRWLTVDKFMYSWYFPPEEVGRISGKVGRAWEDEFARKIYCPANIDGTMGLIRLLDATAGFYAGDIQLAEGAQADA